MDGVGRARVEHVFGTSLAYPKDRKGLIERSITTKKKKMEVSRATCQNLSMKSTPPLALNWHATPRDLNSSILF